MRWRDDRSHGCTRQATSFGTHRVPARSSSSTASPAAARPRSPAPSSSGASQPWLNLGVDAAMSWLPERLHPGIGLRPGGERPDLEDAVVSLYGALYDAIAAHARQGLNVVVDAGLHESYSRPLPIVGDCAQPAERAPGALRRGSLRARRASGSGGRGPGISTASRPTGPSSTRWRAGPGRCTPSPTTSKWTPRSRVPADCAARVLSRLRDGPPGRAFGHMARGERWAGPADQAFSS